MNLKALLLLLNLISPASAFAKDSGSKATKSYLFGFGPTSYSNVNSRSTGVLFSLGYAWNLEPQFDLLAVVDLGTSLKHTDVILLCPQLKGRYMLGDDQESSSSWYVGGGLGIGYAQNHVTTDYPKDTVKSLAFSAAFGLKFLRKSASPLFFEIEHLMYLQESAHGTPISTSLKVGLNFGGGKAK